MEKFIACDFVQVEYWKYLDNLEPYNFWRNALYREKTESGFHVVTYTDGTKEVLHHGIKIRKAII